MPIAPLVDALVFDFGNVVVDIDFTRVFGAWSRSARMPIAEIAQRFAFDAAYEAHELGAMKGAQYFDALRKSCGMALTDDDFLAGWNEVFVAPRAGMAELLEMLACRMPLYLFSNTNALHHAYWSVRYRAILRHFAKIYCSHELGLRKPSPAAFQTIADDIGIVPSRLAFFDDTLENVEGARRAGLHAFHVTTLPQLRDVLANPLRIPL